VSDSSAVSWQVRVLKPQDEHGKRRTALLKAAFDVLAEVGFEGLRTRAVADRAGVNIATLHYYFATKQSLIEGLAQFLGAKFSTEHGPAPAPSGYPALDRLRQEFSDGRYYLEQQPKMLIVMQEFWIRGQRDPEVHKIVEVMGRYWREGLEQMVEAGIADGTFRKDLDPQETLSVVMAIFAGIAVTGSRQIEPIRRSVEAWLVSPDIRQSLTRGKKGKK
jgi:TetR/AcrR family transcriptional regulator, regulator of cefoperazone and chloramphenicol sensitivity